MRLSTLTVTSVAALLVQLLMQAQPAFAVPSTTLTFGLEDISSSQVGEFDIVTVDSCHLRGAPGLPLLPCRSINFVIPRGQSVSRLRVHTSRRTRVPGEYYIAPAQPDSQPGTGPEAEDFVWPDEDVYGSTDPFPDASVNSDHTSMTWGWKLCQVVVWPLVYIPAKREVWLYETVKISVELCPSAEDEQEVMPRSREHHEEWAAELRQAVANPDDVWPLAPNVFSGLSTSRRWVLILPGDQEALGRDRWIDTFQPLIVHRQSQGLDVQVDYVGQITNQSGEAAVQDIRNYLYDQQVNHGARWACLVGDHEMIPWTYAYHWSSADPTDWCYSDLDGAWPGNADWAPELWVGRIPSISKAEAGNLVAKILAYEQDPGGGDTAYLDRAFYEYADDPQGLGTCDEVITHQDPAVQYTLWGELPTYYDPEPYFPWDYDVVNTLSYDHYNYVTHHGHGDTDAYWPISVGIGEKAVPKSSFGLDDMETLSNTDYYFFWYSVSCNHACLDDVHGRRSFAEAATCMHADQGAIAFAASTRGALPTPGMELQCHAWDALFGTGPFTPKYFFNHVGSFEAVAKFRSEQAGDSNDNTRRSHNLFGDPATAIWTPQSGLLKPVAVNEEPMIPVLGIRGFGPNPVRGHDPQISLSLAQSSDVVISAYDTGGRRIGRLYRGMLPCGEQTLALDGSMLPAGAFVLRVVAGQEVHTQKVTIIR